jgi:hypothetical protein
MRAPGGPCHAVYHLMYLDREQPTGMGIGLYHTNRATVLPVFPPPGATAVTIIVTTAATPISPNDPDEPTPLKPLLIPANDPEEPG